MYNKPSRKTGKICLIKKSRPMIKLNLTCSAHLAVFGFLSEKFSTPLTKMLGFCQLFAVLFHKLEKYRNGYSAVRF